MKKEGLIQKKEVTIKRTIIIIKNLYKEEDLLRDVKEQIKIFGKKCFDGEGIDLRGKPKSGKICYLPTCRIKLWGRHLVINLPYLWKCYEKKGFEEYMNKRFGKNWLITQEPVPLLRVILIKNVLEENLSIKENNWKCEGSVFKDEIVLTKINEYDFNKKYRVGEEIGKGIFLK